MATRMNANNEKETVAIASAGRFHDQTASRFVLVRSPAPHRIVFPVPTPSTATCVSRY